MWKRARCGVDVKFNNCEPTIDSIGRFFLCPRCNFRNKLENVGRFGGPLELVQRSELKFPAL